MEISKILVVLDPTDEDQAAFKRALQIAVETSAALHLFVCIDTYVQEHLINQDNIIDAESIDALLTALTTQASDKLIVVNHEIKYERDWYSAIVHSALKNKADVVVKSYSYHSAVERRFRETSDWTLIRNCHCPVLLVKSNLPWQTNKILAAIETTHIDKEHKRLTSNIIDLGRELFHQHNAEVSFVSAYQDPQEFPNEQFVERSNQVPGNSIDVGLGKAEDVIIEKTNQSNVDLLIMGTMGRSGLMGFFMGNTVERVLDKVSCDVLVTH